MNYLPILGTATGGEPSYSLLENSCVQQPLVYRFRFSEDSDLKFIHKITAGYCFNLIYDTLLHQGAPSWESLEEDRVVSKFYKSPEWFPNFTYLY